MKKNKKCLHLHKKCDRILNVKKTHIGSKSKECLKRSLKAVNNMEEITKREELKMAVVAMKQLLEAGVHFGHQTRRWDPKTKRIRKNARRLNF